jgi:hypothetical protein
MGLCMLNIPANHVNGLASVKLASSKVEDIYAASSLWSKEISNGCTTLNEAGTGKSQLAQYVIDSIHEHVPSSLRQRFRLSRAAFWRRFQAGG